MSNEAHSSAPRSVTEAIRAKRLFAEYQAQRQQRARAEHEAAQREGRAETFGTILRQQPLRVLLTLLAILFLLGLVALPAILIHRPLTHLALLCRAGLAPLLLVLPVIRKA